MTDNAAHMINILDLHLSEMVDQIREIYKEEKINIKQTTKFANYLKQVFKEAIGQVDTRQAFEEEETELVHHVKNQFIEIIREVDSIITT